MHFVDAFDPVDSDVNTRWVLGADGRPCRKLAPVRLGIDLLIIDRPESGEVYPNLKR